jgi:predicted metal-binding protein
MASAAAVGPTVNHPSVNHPSTLFVCTACGGKPTIEGSKRQGERLLEQLQTLHPDTAGEVDFAIAPVKCMGVCDRPCAIAFVRAGKFTYLFGDLPDSVDLSATATTVLECFGQYCDHPAGLLPYADRPELLRDTIIAKIPS